jgi:hypothetical protein
MSSIQQSYDTPIPLYLQPHYKKWLKQIGQDPGNASKDYDMQGYWLNGGYKETGHQGHFPDTWKKPNHPTFSNESIYSGKVIPYNQTYGQGGQWGEENGRDTFTPSQLNLQNMQLKKLMDYFKRVEPNAILKR